MGEGGFFYHLTVYKAAGLNLLPATLPPISAPEAAQPVRHPSELCWHVVLALRPYLPAYVRGACQQKYPDQISGSTSNKRASEYAKRRQAKVWKAVFHLHVNLNGYADNIKY